MDKLTSEIAVNQCHVQSQARMVTVRGLDPARSSAGDEEEQGEKQERKEEKVIPDMFGGEKKTPAYSLK